MQFLRTHGIRLNVCPSSNVALSRVARISAHPIRRLVDDGVRVSINSDDPTIFGRSVSEEYLALYAAAVLSAAELDGIREDSLRS
jgi:adenosine deaminase